ncbi:MAG: histone deacetylase [Myxococcota bacterium]|nr:histone deacetylase [Myxococcota bacterium]
MKDIIRTAIGFDSACLEHHPGDDHPERPMRLEALRPVIEGALAEAHTVSLPKRAASVDELCRVHTPMYVDRVRATAGTTIRLDPDTIASPFSAAAACHASGQLLEAVDTVFDGRANNAFVAVRPPGHHAEPTHAMGFCFFNSIAVAAEYARARYAVRRIAVVDIDVHHGNGTQSAFWDDPHTLFISTHQAPHYPGTGAISDLGGKDAQGMTLNIPLTSGHGDREYVAIYSALVARVLEQHAPELILVSAGLDMMDGDPLGSMAVTPSGVGQVARALIAAAARTAGGRIVFALEGGYDLTNLRNGTQACLEALYTADVGNRTLSPWKESELGDARHVLPVWRTRWRL